MFRPDFRSIAPLEGFAEHFGIYHPAAEIADESYMFVSRQYCRLFPPVQLLTSLPGFSVVRHFLLSFSRLCAAKVYVAFAPDRGDHHGLAPAHHVRPLREVELSDPFFIVGIRRTRGSDQPVFPVSMPHPRRRAQHYPPQATSGRRYCCRTGRRRAVWS